MQQRRTTLVAVASLTVFSLLAGACASAADTGEVSAASGRYGAALETSTTIPGDAASLTGGRTATGSRRTQATENLLSALAENPALLNDLENLTPEQLEELTGLDSDELGTLGITPATVGALGGILNQIGGSDEDSLDPALAAALAAGGGSLLNEAGGLTDEATALLLSLDIDPATFATLIATAISVPSNVTSELGVLLAILDPNGLGQFSGDESALSVIAVLIGAVLGRDPVALGQLANGGDIDPRFRGLLGFVTNLATTLSPQFVNRVNNITDILGPYTLQAIGAAVGLLERPAVGAIFEEAFSDPTTVASAFGAALLFIPGLPESIAPDTFADPNAIYSAVLGVSAVALLNADAPGFRDFLQAIGVVIPPDLLD